MINNENFITYLRNNDTDIDEIYNIITPSFLAEFSLRYPIFFAKYIVGFKDVDLKVHKSIEDFLRSNFNYRLFLLPRSSFKTSIITISESVRNACQNPNIRILVDSENFTNSSNMLNEIGHIIENNELIFKLYGIEPGKKWNDKEKTIKRSGVMKESTFTASGIGNEKTSAHYDIIKSDDLVTPRNIKTVEQRNKVREHFKYNLSLLDPGGIYDVIGTRYSDLDLYGWIIEKLKGPNNDQFKILIEKAIKEDGSLYFPQRLSYEYLEDKKKKQGNYIFSCQYLNEPVNSELQELDHKKLKIETEIPNYIKRVAISSLDPASEDEKGTGNTDYSAIITLAMDEKNDLWILDIDITRGDELEVADLVIKHLKSWNSLRFIPEKNGFQKVYKNIIKYKIKEKKINTKIIPVSSGPYKSKKEKIRKLVPFNEAGKIHIYYNIIKNKPKEWEELKDEMDRFPVAKHDDILDAIQQAFDYAIKPRKPEENKTIYYEEFLKSHGLFQQKKYNGVKRNNIGVIR